MIIRIEKRLPFGFKGEWGKLYKLYVSNAFSGQNESLEWQQSTYMDIGQDIQLAHLGDGLDRKIEVSQAVTNLIDKGEYVMRKTTDAYFDDELEDYRCIVDIGDIIKIGKQYYVCDKIDVKEIETPKDQHFYYLGLKKIYNNILTGVQNA